MLKGAWEKAEEMLGLESVRQCVGGCNFLTRLLSICTAGLPNSPSHAVTSEDTCSLMCWADNIAWPLLHNCVSELGGPLAVSPEPRMAITML